MSFTQKQLIYLFLFLGGAFFIGLGIFLYQEEMASFALSSIICLLGAAIEVAAELFLQRKMRCSFCHHIYPIDHWWGMECCPYCGHYFD